MKDENLFLIVVAIFLFGALFAFVDFDSHKATWKGIDNLFFFWCKVHINSP